MAEYRLAVQTVQRALGRSAVAAAAYRSGTRLTDDRLAMEFDFRSKADVEFETILAPDNAPLALHHRLTLWNAAEAAEHRKDAVPAREILLSLPHELNLDQRRALTLAFAAQYLVSRGMIADVALHRPGNAGDERNFHAHILVTTRTVGADGFGPKSLEWRTPAMLREWRAGWATIQNEHLRQHLGPDAPQVSHLSLTARGQEREPTVHLGPAATALERRAIFSERGEQNRDVEALNRKRQEVRREYQDQADRLATFSPRIAVSVSRLVEEAGVVLARMIVERDAMVDERAGIVRPNVDSVQMIERELIQPAKLARAAAKFRLRKVEGRVSWLKARRQTLAHWVRNPARMIWAKHAELNAIAQARTAVQRAEIALAVRMQWTASTAGQSYIAGQREPQLKAAAEIATRRRTLERKIRRADKRILGATRVFNDLLLARALGRKELEVPATSPDETRFFRDVGGAALTAAAQYPANARELAAARLDAPQHRRGEPPPSHRLSPDF